MSYEMALEACRPSSFSGYLRSLGVFRILAKQFNPEIRLHWKEEIPYLTFPYTTDVEEVTTFFYRTYEPTPIVIPWSGSDFFEVSPPFDSGPFKKPPTKNGIIEAFLASNFPRLKTYRDSTFCVLEIIDDYDFTKSKINAKTKEGKALKAEFMALLRSNLPDEMVRFMDVAALIGENRFLPNTLLGSGGGSDGNLLFGGNFMQCLWLCLPDFKPQRGLRGKAYRGFDSKAAFRQALFGGEEDKVIAIPGDTPGLYSPGGVGGPNAVEGFEAESLRNPWSFILLMEGLPLFSGALSRRSGSRGAGVDLNRASFPFICRVSVEESTSITLKESGGREVWFPLWGQPASLKSVKTVLAEGRAEVAGRQAKDGVDFARAVASLGVDRGISKFQRYSIVKGRVGGENYHTTVRKGTMQTHGQPLDNVNLLEEIDKWLNRLQYTVRVNDSSAKRYGSHLRSVEEAILYFCKGGGPRRLQQVLRELGKAERSFAFAGKGRPVNPLSLSPRWVPACEDGSVEYRLACALASIYHPKVGPIRVQMEPVKIRNRFLRWVDDQKAVAWGRGSLLRNLGNVLQRRVMDGIRLDSDLVPLSGRLSVSTSEVHSFLTGQIDERKLSDLLWGLITVRWREYQRELHGFEGSKKYQSTPKLPRIYALLKIVNLPGALLFSKKGRWKISYNPEEGTRFPPVPEIVRLIKAGRLQNAVKKSVHRIVASGLTPLGSIRGKSTVPDFYVESDVKRRLPGALLIPIWDIDSLVQKVLRTPSEPEKRRDTVPQPPPVATKNIISDKNGKE